MGANATESTVSADTKAAESLSTVEDSLTEQAANVASDESYLGEAAEAEILDVRTEDVDDDVSVEFEVSLPNSKVGIISFSNYEFSEGRVESFLDNIDCTVGDMTDAMYHSVPVTFTNWKGWVVLYGDQEKHLDATYAGTSDWYGIDEDTAHPQPNRKYSTLLSSPFYVGVIASLLMWSIVPVVMGVIGAGFIWYLNCMQVGMSMPHRKPISVSDD